MALVKNLRFRTIGIVRQKSYQFQTFGASLYDVGVTQLNRWKIDLFEIMAYMWYTFRLGFNYFIEYPQLCCGDGLLTGNII
jgi:hypothetical protein